MLVVVDGVKGSREIKKQRHDTFVILFHWWDALECTAGQFQWNHVYSRHTSEN